MKIKFRAIILDYKFLVCLYLEYIEIDIDKYRYMLSYFEGGLKKTIPM